MDAEGRRVGGDLPLVGVVEESRQPAENPVGSRFAAATVDLPAEARASLMEKATERGRWRSKRRNPTTPSTVMGAEKRQR